MVAQNLNVDLCSENDDGGGIESLEKQMKALEVLHLILPLSMVPLKGAIIDNDDDYDKPDQMQKISQVPGDIGGISTVPEKKPLRGYETLQELRTKTANFRQAYLDWRKFKPHGAKGEATDLFTGRKVSDAGAKVELSIIKNQAGTIGLIGRDQRSDSEHSVLFTRIGSSVSPRHFDVSAPAPIGITPGTTTVAEMPLPDALKDAVKTVDDEDKWLRFYYNPLTPLATAPVLPVLTETLSKLASRPGVDIQIPTYSRDPSTVTHWILHLGVGQFHRSHQLVFLDELLNQKEKRLLPTSTARHTASNAPPVLPTTSSATSLAKKVRRSSSAERVANEKWGYCGVGLMPFDLKMANALRQQNLLYTVLSRTNTSSSVRVIGSMLDYIFAYEEPQRAYSKLIDPNLYIISLTVTEKGYCQDVQGHLDLENPLVCHDLELLKYSNKNQLMKRSPRSAVGFLYWGIRERQRLRLRPFTVMSCDNLPENGQVAKSMVTAFARRLDPMLADWIASNVQFPSTMVDRITPATVVEHREILAKDYGISDEWPVVTEEYMQWVIEDNFSYRPAWESAGALLVADVRPFELMKLRLLNGGHSMIGYISFLAGYSFVDDAINDVKISSFLRAYMDEVTSTIRNVSIELERYKEKIVERFGNRMIKDRLLRLCEDGSTKFFNTLKDALTELITEGRHIQWATLGIASFILFLATSEEDIILDGKKELLIRLAKDAFADATNTLHVSNFLQNVFGKNLGTSPSFVNQTCLALFALTHCSVQSVLKSGGTLEALFSKQIRSSNLFNSFIQYTVACQAL